MDSIRDFAESPLAAGIAGALLAAFKFLPGTNWSEKFINVVGGCAFTWFVTPGIIAWYSIKQEGMTSTVSFLLGAFGLSLAAAISSGIKEANWGDIIRGWFSKTPKE